jgi:hypothetical protein
MSYASGTAAKGSSQSFYTPAQRQECANSGHYRRRGERIESTLSFTRNRLFVQPGQLLALP